MTDSLEPSVLAQRYARRRAGGRRPISPSAGDQLLGELEARAAQYGHPPDHDCPVCESARRQVLALAGFRLPRKEWEE